MERLHTSTGRRRNQIFLTSMCLVALLMCSFQSISEKHCNPHSKKCIFVGYPDGTKAWRFWDPVDRKIIISSHAVFDERCFPGNSTTSINLLSPTPPPPEVVLHQGGDDSDDDEAPEPEQLPAPQQNNPFPRSPQANQ